MKSGGSVFAIWPKIWSKYFNTDDESIMKFSFTLSIKPHSFDANGFLKCFQLLTAAVLLKSKFIWFSIFGVFYQKRTLPLSWWMVQQEINFILFDSFKETYIFQETCETGILFCVECLWGKMGGEKRTTTWRNSDALYISTIYKWLTWQT